MQCIADLQFLELNCTAFDPCCTIPNRMRRACRTGPCDQIGNRLMPGARIAFWRIDRPRGDLLTRRETDYFDSRRIRAFLHDGRINTMSVEYQRGFEEPGSMAGRGHGSHAGSGNSGCMQRGRFGRGGNGWRHGRRHQSHATGLNGRQRAAAENPVPPLPVGPASTSEDADLQSLRAQAEATVATLDKLLCRIEALSAVRRSGNDEQ